MFPWPSRRPMRCFLRTTTAVASRANYAKCDQDATLPGTNMKWHGAYGLSRYWYFYQYHQYQPMGIVNGNQLVVIFQYRCLTRTRNAVSKPRRKPLGTLCRGHCRATIWCNGKASRALPFWYLSPKSVGHCSCVPTHELCHNIDIGSTARNDFSVAMNDNRRSARDHRLDVDVGVDDDLFLSARP
jgi:hypothetical protein